MNKLKVYYCVELDAEQETENDNETETETEQRPGNSHTRISLEQSYYV